MKRLAALLLGLLCTLSVPAWAQSVEMAMQLSAREVEVGEPFQVLVTVFAASGETPQGPRLKLPPGLSAQGPSVSSQQQVSIMGGGIQQRTGISASWVVTAQRPGRFTIGPATVRVGGHPATGKTVTVQVVPRGQGRRRDPFGSPFDLFDRLDPFGGMGRFPGFPRLPPIPGWDEPEPRLPEAPESFRVDRAPDATAFLRAFVEPKQVVVGQPLLYRVYAYGRRGPFNESSPKETSRPDFLTQPIVPDSEKEPLYQVTIGGETWFAKRVRELLLFPLKTGRLTLEPFKMTFAGPAYMAGQKLPERESAALELVVTEPPLAGRPSGYQLGDVGQFELHAAVEPRQCRRGDSVSVVVQLSGTGNFPLRLRLPQQHGVEWLEPTVADELAPKNASLAGSRRFTYVVRVDRDGRIDLGEIRLPYWDPERQAYATAKTGLGFLEVAAPAAGQKAIDAAGSDPLKGLLEPRPRLGAPPVHRTPWGDSPWFWCLLGAGPVGVVLVRAGTRGGRWVGQRWRARRRSSQYLAAQAVREARQSALAGDGSAAASALERALYLALESATGLRARALLRPELTVQLGTAGLGPELVAEVGRVLDACDAQRFTGSLDGTISDLVARAEQAMAELGRVRRRPGSRGAA